MSARLGELFHALDRHPGRIPVADLERELQGLEIGWDDVARWVRFDDHTYRRNLMHEGPSYQALLLCWRSGQRSPIHDHRGSNCGVRVLKGVAIETVFERTPQGCVYATRSNELAPGAVCATQDMDIHQVSNLQEDRSDLVTLHVYSPPLLNMGTYSLFDTAVGEFLDPVHQELYVDGGGI
jgi:cysteine dioxygenase